MNDPSPPQAKRLFYNLCVEYELYYEDLEALAEAANVHMSVVGDMFVTVAVKRVEAEKVLTAFSEHTGTTWTMNTVRVALMQTFADLHATHHFDLSQLAIDAGVLYTAIKRMLRGEAVTPQEARLVLQMVSRITSEHYTLETVDVPTTNEEEEQ